MRQNKFGTPSIQGLRSSTVERSGVPGLVIQHSFLFFLVPGRGPPDESGYPKKYAKVHQAARGLPLAWNTVWGLVS